MHENMKLNLMQYSRDGIHPSFCDLSFRRKCRPRDSFQNFKLTQKYSCNQIYIDELKNFYLAEVWTCQIRIFEVLVLLLLVYY